MFEVELSLLDTYLKQKYQTFWRDDAVKENVRKHKKISKTSKNKISTPMKMKQFIFL